MTVGAIQSRHSRPAAARSQLGRGATARRGIRLGRHVRHPPLAKPGDPEASSGPGDGEQRLDSDQRTREPCTRSHPARTSCPCTSRSTRAGKPCGVQIWGDVDLSNHHRLPPRSPRSTLRVSMQSTWTSDSSPSATRAAARPSCVRTQVAAVCAPRPASTASQLLSARSSVVSQTRRPSPEPIQIASGVGDPALLRGRRRPWFPTGSAARTSLPCVSREAAPPIRSVT
jgi:hypothetical protein